MKTITSKQKQGRPSRNSGFCGRDKLIEGTRTYLRTKGRINITRSEIAIGCGVTPALISYYFKGQDGLINAVARPLIASYSQHLKSILTSHAAGSGKVKRVIRLLIELNADDAFLVDLILQHLHNLTAGVEERATFQAFREGIAGLINEFGVAGAWRCPDPLDTEVALWGLSRAFGELLRAQQEQSLLTLWDREAVLDAKVECVYATLVRPASPMPNAGRPENADLLLLEAV